MTMKLVMVVDDQPTVIRVLKLAIEKAGYAVDTAKDGMDCLAKLRDALPDFLVTDIDMPRMTGKELCAAIDKQFPDRRFPIVVLTSRTELEHRDWTRRMRNLSFMEKPVSVRQLVSLIDERIDGSESQGDRS